MTAIVEIAKKIKVLGPILLEGSKLVLRNMPSEGMTIDSYEGPCVCLIMQGYEDDVDRIIHFVKMGEISIECRDSVERLGNLNISILVPNGFPVKTEATA